MNCAPLRNLLDNAVRHARSKVVLDVTRDGSTCTVTVHNDGTAHAARPVPGTTFALRIPAAPEPPAVPTAPARGDAPLRDRHCSDSS